MPIWEAHRASADAFFARLTPAAEPVKIPYEGTTLPGYALTVDTSGKPRPWLIMNNGSDGTVTDMWVQGAAEALRRGYNVLIFGGPGQGAALYRQKLYFRPDWEKVITPVVDWLLTRPDVDAKRISLLGISQGGYWVPRAVAFEHRIAAAIVDPGVYNVATAFTSSVPPQALQALNTAQGAALDQLKKEFDQGVEQAMQQSPVARYTLTSRMGPYGTTSFAELLLKVQAYTLTDTPDQAFYFSDRPGRVVGVAPMQQFLDGLGFSPQNPSNAALVAQTAIGEDVLVIELLNPRNNEAAHTLTYDARVLEYYEGEGLAFLAKQQNDDTMEATFTDASLFIDDCPDLTMCYIPAYNSCACLPVGNIPGEPYGQCWSWSKVSCQPCRNYGDLAALCNKTYSQCKGACLVS